MDRLSWMIFPTSPTRWWFQIFFMFIHLYLGKIPNFTNNFSYGLVQPPTSPGWGITLDFVWFRVNNPKVDNLQALLSKKSFDFTWGFPWIPKRWFYGKKQRYGTSFFVEFGGILKKKKGPTQMEKSKLYRMKFKLHINCLEKWWNIYQFALVNGNMVQKVERFENFKCHLPSSQPVLRPLVPLVQPWILLRRPKGRSTYCICMEMDG